MGTPADAPLFLPPAPAPPPVLDLRSLQALARLQAPGVSLDGNGARALEVATRYVMGELAAAAWPLTLARGGRVVERGDVSLAALAAPARFGFAADLLPLEDLVPNPPANFYIGLPAAGTGAAAATPAAAVASTHRPPSGADAAAASAPK